MSGNSLGIAWKITTFGESHGNALGVVIDGCPSGIHFDEVLLKSELRKRQPGLGEVTSSRRELDVPEILSGVYKGVTTGTPIALIVRNVDARSEDYEKLEQNPRVGHADDVWRGKFQHSDPRGGGRSSGRETVARVLSGSVALMFLRSQFRNLEILPHLVQLGPLSLKCSPYELSAEALNLLMAAKTDGQSYGGQLEFQIQGVPAYLGQPVFHKLKADLAHAIFGIGGVNALEFGLGSTAAHARGTDFHSERMGSEERRYGGIRGGISTGEDIHLKVSFKPTASISNVALHGRHDPCIAIRGSVVVEHMIYNVLADHTLLRRLDAKDFN